MIEAIFPSPAH
jgi:retinol dehydrogenase-12